MEFGENFSSQHSGRACTRAVRDQLAAHAVINASAGLFFQSAQSDLASAHADVLPRRKRRPDHQPLQQVRTPLRSTWRPSLNVN